MNLIGFFLGFETAAAAEASVAIDLACEHEQKTWRNGDTIECHRGL